MNLKEAFRFQNKLNELITKTEDILRVEGNIMTVTNTVMKSKVDKEAENEVTREAYRFSLFDLDGRVTKLADFLMYLFEERRKLSFAIEKTKSALDISSMPKLHSTRKGRRLWLSSAIWSPSVEARL